MPLFPVVVKDRSQPFPCQDCSCSCRDAASCWRDCCCYNDEEKLAWAAANGVTPPEYVVLRAAAARTKGSDKSCTRCCACSQRSTPQDGPAATDSAEKTWTVVTLSGVSQCRGQGFLSAVLAAALPDYPVDAWRPELQVRPIRPAAVRWPLALNDPPPTPPPRGCVGSLSALR
ncbi:hypothetical protein [Lignipirellula cremea]|uniref:hypothetical protein n=1 Tax=Lignipirellula cremea TaxID=2528010 RepID=UPI00119E98EF|nr:hypothetical protein [Lignipirellula cremea]